MSSRLRGISAAVLAAAAVALLTASVGTVPIPAAGDRFFVSSGRMLRQRSDAIDAMERVRELRLRQVQEDTLVVGRQHERLDQYYKGVRVFGGEVVRETDGKLALSITGTLYGPLEIDTTPTLTPEEALAVFERETGAPSVPRSAPELVILPKDDGTFVLAYRVTAFVKRALPVMLINAKTGAVELRYNNLKTQQPAAGTGTGVYGDEKKVSGTLEGTVFQAWDQMRPTKVVTHDLRGSLSRMSLLEAALAPLVSSDIATSSSSRWSDPVVVDVHSYLGWTYDYFYKRHGWKGLDNRNSRPLYALVHPVYRQDLDRHDADESSMYYLNAYFCPQCGANSEDILMFGEGLPPGYYIVSTGQWVNYFGASIDIVAHEFAHGVTDYSSALTYRGESGALSEAFSDIMSTAVEFFFQQPGTGSLKADYLVGEDTFIPKISGAKYGMRSLSDPAAYGDPDHYSKRYVGKDDEGGVHTNGAIAAHAFYLAIEGGTNRTSGLSVRGVGPSNREQIEKVFFRAFTTLPADASFSQARERTIQSSRDIYPSVAAVERAVTEAWTAVGVQ
jgi:thermolysin